MTLFAAANQIRVKATNYSTVQQFFFSLSNDCKGPLEQYNNQLHASASKRKSDPIHSHHGIHFGHNTKYVFPERGGNPRL